MTPFEGSCFSEFENFHIGIALVDPELTILDVNPAFCTITGHSREDITGNPFRPLCNQGDFKHIDFRMNQIKKGKSDHFTTEIRLHSTSGQIRWGELNVSVVRDTSQKLLRCYLMIEDTTLRRNIDLDLIESENKFRTLFASSKDAISIFTEDRIIDCNNSLCQLFGGSKETLLSMSAKNLAPVHQPDGTLTDDKMKQQIQLALEGSKNQFEWVFLTLQNKPFHAEVKLSPIEIKGEIYFQTVIRDISQRKRMEEALQKNEQRLRRLIENGAEIITIVSKSGERLFLSENVEKITGYSPDELIGGSTFSLIHPDDIQDVVKLFMDLSEIEDSTATMLYRVRSVSGEWLIFESTGRNLIHDPLIQGIVINSRDVTQQIQGKEVLSMYRNIVSSSKELMGFFDTKEQLLVCNDSFRDMFTIPSPQEETLTLNSIFSGEDVLSAIRSSYVNCLMGREIHTVTWHEKNKEKIILDISMYPFRDQEENITGVAINCRNTTRELLQEMEILNSTERERKRIGIELHDGLSHELLGMAIKSRILADNLNDLGLKEAAEAMDIEKRLNEAISTTRGMAHGLFPVNLEKTGLDGLLNETAIMLEEQKGISCTLNIEKPVFIHDQKTGLHLHNILQECAVNIIKHSDARNVAISLENENGYITITISDDGKGFEYKKKSEGMGLNIMEYRARLIGADLRITGIPGKGTTLFCRLKI